MTNYYEEKFRQHCGLLQLGDNFSLYLCINEPGVSKSEEHSVFKNGIPSPGQLHGLPHHRMDIRFISNDTITVVGFPYDEPFHVNYSQRIVKKNSIYDQGLQIAYSESEVEKIRLEFKSK
ncbi:DUF3891 family protein [Sporosarcina sp. A2]|uniref:DUF3891 family protein n=1 Tax=Sporosarcina sp. A2 TaxID=3393449 RepID=UPI003D7A68C1